jgi:hypothetical protein
MYVKCRNLKNGIYERVQDINKAMDLSGLFRYCGSPQGGELNSIVLFMNGMIVEPASLRKWQRGLFKESDYWVINIIPQFREFPVSEKYKEYKIAVRSCDVNINFSNGSIHDCYPKRIDEELREFDFKLSLGAKMSGGIEFTPIKIGAENESTLTVEGKLPIEMINVTCYCTFISNKVEWQYKSKTTENYLVAGIDSYVIIQCATNQHPKGDYTLTPSNIVMVRKGRPIEGLFDRINARLKGVSPSRLWYDSLKGDFEFNKPSPFSDNIHNIHIIKPRIIPPVTPDFPEDVQIVIDEEIENYVNG